MKKLSGLMHYSFIGSKQTVAAGLAQFQKETQVDELIVISHIYDHSARLKSYKIVSELFEAKNVPAYSS